METVIYEAEETATRPNEQLSMQKYVGTLIVLGVSHIGSGEVGLWITT